MNKAWVALALVILGCSGRHDWGGPVVRVAPDGGIYQCPSGITYISDAIGRCWKEDGAFVDFITEANATIERKTVAGTVMNTELGGWQMVDSFDKLIARIEGMFEKWLKDMEERPISTGLKALVAFLVIRFIWRRVV